MWVKLERLRKKTKCRAQYGRESIPKIIFNEISQAAWLVLDGRWPWKITRYLTQAKSYTVSDSFAAHSKFTLAR